MEIGNGCVGRIHDQRVMGTQFALHVASVDSTGLYHNNIQLLRTAMKPSLAKLAAGTFLLAITATANAAQTPIVIDASYEMQGQIHRPRDPYTDGGRIAERDVYTDGARSADGAAR